jgi:dipeptidyl aminopeptidase/acylaminoacyl peptidase
MMLVLTAIAFPAMVGAQQKRSPTPAETLGRALIRSPAISPDGKYVAYLQRQTNWKTDEFVTQLWLANVSTGKRLQLTRGRKSVGPAQWSPDGRWLAFATERELTETDSDGTFCDGPAPPGRAADRPCKSEKSASRQIWFLPFDGGEAWQATRSPADVGDFHWSSDGNSILFIATAPPTDAALARTERYGHLEVAGEDYEQRQLWRVNARRAIETHAPAPAIQLTFDPALSVTSFADSPDATKIVFSAAPKPLLSSAGEQDLYLLDLHRDNTVRKIVALRGPDTSPMFSPDGTRLAFLTSLGRADYLYANHRIGLIDLAAAVARPASRPADVRDISTGFDESPQPIAWVDGGLYFKATRRVATPLFRVDMAKGRIQEVTQGQGWIIDDVSLTPDGRSVAFIAEDSSHMTELYVSSARLFSPRRLTDVTAQADGWTVGGTEVVSWKSKDGLTIEGVLRKPADFDPKRRYPLLVMIHGGPTSASQPRFLPADGAYPVQALLAKGALVLEPNYRGSAGYGAAFRALNVRNLGVGDTWDVMSGIDFLVDRGMADPHRLGAMGWSQGGYICAFLSTHVQRFKAISVGAGISDWTTYYVGTDINQFATQYFQATPWEDPRIYARSSPITTIRLARTPTLIQQGGADQRVPVANALELYRGLLDQHVDARLIIYSGSGHDLDKPKSLLAAQRANLDWFSHHLWAEPFPVDSALYGAGESTRASFR